MKEQRSVKPYKKPLWEDISSFSRRKYGWVVLLLALALLGFVIPILPGFLFLLLAVALLKPGWMARVRRGLNKLWRG